MCSGVRNLVAAEVFRVLPGASCDKTHEDHFEAVPVAFASPVPAERMLVDRDRDDRFDPFPNDVFYFPVQRAHNA